MGHQGCRKWQELVCNNCKGQLQKNLKKKQQTTSQYGSIVSVEFACLFLRCHFAGKPLVASQNVSCFVILFWGGVCKWEVLLSLFGALWRILRAKMENLACYNMLKKTNEKSGRNSYTIWAANQNWEAIAMFVLQLYCFICQRNHAAIFKGQIMAEKTKPICKFSIS